MRSDDNIAHSCGVYGLYSLSGKTSHRQIAWSVDGRYNDRIALQFDRHVERCLDVKFHND